MQFYGYIYRICCNIISIHQQTFQWNDTQVTLKDRPAVRRYIVNSSRRSTSVGNENLLVLAKRETIGARSNTPQYKTIQ